MFCQEVFAIDTHSHIVTGKPVDPEINETYDPTEETLNNLRLAARIEKSFISSFASVIDPTYVLAENEYIRELCLEKEYLYQWVVVDPRIEETLIQAKDILKDKKCVGIKLHPVYHKYSVLEFGEPVFALAAEYNTRILIHPEADAPHILPLADKYPDATVIMAHLSGKSNDHIEAIKRSRYGNIYTDVATMKVITNNVVENAVKQIGSERILFGTDTYSAGFIRGRIEYSPISEEDKINILRNNALRLFRDKI